MLIGKNTCRLKKQRVPNKFHTSSAKKLTLNQTPVIIVPGKAFFDVGHSLKEQRSNLRSHLPEYAAWEIHPVMKLESTYVVTLRQNCRRVGESRQPNELSCVGVGLCEQVCHASHSSPRPLSTPQPKRNTDELIASLTRPYED